MEFFRRFLEHGLAHHLRERRAVVYLCGAVVLAVLVLCLTMVSLKYSRLADLHYSGFVTISIACAPEDSIMFDVVERLWWHRHIERSGWMPGVHAVIITGPMPRRVSGRALDSLGKLQNAVHLDVSHSGIEDGGVARIARVRVLESLVLAFNPITDEGLKYLNGMPSLKKLDLRGTAVSFAAIERFRMAMPACEVLVDSQSQFDPMASDEESVEQAPK